MSAAQGLAVTALILGARSLVSAFSCTTINPKANILSKFIHRIVTVAIGTTSNGPGTASLPVFLLFLFPNSMVVPDGFGSFISISRLDQVDKTNSFLTTSHHNDTRLDRVTRHIIHVNCMCRYASLSTQGLQIRCKQLPQALRLIFILSVASTGVTSGAFLALYSRFRSPGPILGSKYAAGRLCLSLVGKLSRV